MIINENHTSGGGGVHVKHAQQKLAFLEISEGWQQEGHSTIENLPQQIV